MRIRRCALYIRVSTEEQVLHGYSIETQKANLTEYCKENNLKIVDYYADEGISGAKPPMKRPALKRLLEDVEAGKIDIILFTKLDRWFRSVKEYFKVQDILDKNKVEWKTIHENYDTTTANGQMAITIFLAVAQNERDRTAERIKVVLDQKRKNKEACFGGPVLPFGYMKQEDERGVMRLVKDPETEHIVQEFWNTLIKSNNLNKSIRLMGEKYGIYKDWKTWKRISQTDFYCGMHRGVQDFCPPYVTPEDFLKFQERDTVKGTPSGCIYYFRGKMRCPECGNKLCGSADKRHKRINKSYRCNIRGRGCNNHKAVPEKKMEKHLLENLDKYLRATIIEAEVENTTPTDRIEVEKRIKNIKEKSRRLNVMYMAGNKSDEEYLKEDAELKVALSKAEEELQVVKPRDVDHLKELLNTDFRYTYSTLTEQEKQEFWQRLIKEIHIEDKYAKEVIFF